MQRWVGTAFFLAVAISLVLGMHYYLYVRWVRDTQLPQPWRGVAIAVLVTLALGLILMPLLSRGLGLGLDSRLVWLAFFWMGAGFVAVIVVLGVDFVQWLSTGAVALARAEAGPADPTRRVALARMFGGASVTLAVTAGALAFREATTAPRLERVRVALGRWPSSLSGFRIVQLTDIHVGPTVGRAYLEDLVRRTNELEPDLIAITGDLVDGSVAELASEVAPLAGLSARYGVFFVTGNHEYYSGAAAWCAHLETLGIRVLRNERVSIGEGEASFELAGVDDWTAHQFGGGHGRDLTRALDGRDPEREVVLLAHQPKQIQEAAEKDVGLVLSGHTHGGQIWPFVYLVYLAQPFVRGLHRVGKAQIYVSRGTGYWGPPMRLLASAELTLLTLEREGARV